MRKPWFKGWLLRITQRRIVDQFRKRPPWQQQGNCSGRSSTKNPGFLLD